MTKDTFILVLGMWVALEPFLGFPQMADRWILSFTGLILFILGFMLRHDTLHRTRSESRRGDTFVQNAPAHDTHANDRN